MARIAGINIPLNKHVVISLTAIYGIGDTRAKQICEAAGVEPSTPVKDLAEPEVAKLRTAVAAFTVEGDLRRETAGKVILALSATVDGQTTAHYIGERLAGREVAVSRLAHGVPVGGELDYLDDGTLTAALKARRPA